MTRFNPNPGPRERRLKRYYENPFIHPEKRKVSRQALENAQEMDHLDVLGFRDEFMHTLEAAAKLKPEESSDRLLQLKENMDKLYEKAAGLGNGLEEEKSALKKLVAMIMQSVQRNAGQDELAQKELEEEQIARNMHYKLLEFPLVADLLNPDSLLGEDDLVPVLLTEESDAVRAAFGLFEKTQQDEVYNRAKELLDSTQLDKELNSRCLERLALLKGLLHEVH